MVVGGGALFIWWNSWQTRFFWYRQGYDCTYRKLYNIRRTKSPNLTVYRLVLQFSLPNPMKPGVKSRMKM